MMDSKPKILLEDYDIVQIDPDGNETKSHPRTSILHWKEANILLSVPHDSTYSSLSKRELLGRILPLLLQKKDGTYSYLHIDLCLEVLYLNLDTLSQDQLDKLSGSFEPTLEKPVGCEEAAGPLEVPKQSFYPLRKRKLYETLELTKI